MTLVVVNSSTESDQITAHSDSRVSATYSPLIDSAAKIFSLPIKIFKYDQIKIFDSSFGFAFAGSALVAQTLYLFLSASLQTLRSDEGQAIPSLEDVSRFAAHMLRKIAKEMGDNCSDYRRVGTEIFIFGYCPVCKTRKLFKAVTQVTDTSFDVGFGELDVIEPGKTYYLGDEKAVKYFFEQYDLLEEPSIGRALKKVIEADNIERVGGDIQYLKANQLGARILPVLHKTEKGTVIIKIQNQNLDGITVGPCHFKNVATGVF